jgi:hypothetical protein
VNLSTMPPLRLLVLALLPLSACLSPSTTARYTYDPVVVVHAPAGDELGVSTDYGIVFLGRRVQTGRIEFTAWFGDGPAREEGLIERLTDELYLTKSEIELCEVPLCLDLPPAGTPVIVRGRRGSTPFEIEAVLAADERVQGVLLANSPELAGLSDADLGAGIFLVRDGKPRELVGLVTGRVEFGDGKSYVAAVGPEELWRLAVQHRDNDRPRRTVYREDLL